ncbi:MAG: hypothetical protein PVS3B3_36270 [Ktedonobacteraceae bacterium]
MICAYCKMVRAENTDPCINCGAPSPVQATPRKGGLLSGQYQSSTVVPSASIWEHQSQAQQAQPSLLPIPYQGGMGLQSVPQPTAMQVMPAPSAQDILISPPSHEEGVIYVPPMYTKPRPIIPRYRIISGFLSVIIVSLMVCGGAGYYAKASGKLDMVSRVLTGNNPAPPSIRPTTPALPDPPDKVDIGSAAAYSVITSATTTAHLVKGTTIAAQTDKIFKPNETFYLTYSVHPLQTGTVTIKWYMNNLQLPYSTTPGQPLPANQPLTGIASMVYAAQAEGKVELYWNNERAQTLYFVVRY